MLTRQDVLAAIQEKQTFCLGPAEIRVDCNPPNSSTLNAISALDALFLLNAISLWVSQRGQEYECIVQFIAEEIGFTALSTSKALGDTISKLKHVTGRGLNRHPLIIAPFLSERHLNKLVTEGFSGIDLCGNGVLIYENLFIFKTGQKNRYPQSTQLRNAYQGVSSLVPRALLTKPTFSSVTELAEFIKQHSGRISLSQVSKALKQLKEDLFISREGDMIRVIQGEAMLDALVREYKPPHIIDRWIGRCSDDALDALLAKVHNLTRYPNPRYAIMGYSVAGRVSGFEGESVRSIFTDAPITPLLDGVGGNIEEGRRFANIEILRTDSTWVYFERSQHGGCGVSDIQFYLELATGDKRQREASLRLRQRILAKLNNGKNKQ